MSETTYSVGEFPGHVVLAEILDQGPMPKEPGMSGAAINLNPLDKYLWTLQRIIEDCGYPTTSMELDALIASDRDKGRDPDELAMRFTVLLRLVHRTKSAWKDGDLSRFGYYMGQLSKVTAEAKYYEKLPHTISGMKSYVGGQKGAKKRAQYKGVKESTQQILQVAKNLIDAGYDHRGLAGILHRRFSNMDGFPSSERQYRTILRSLK
jgi:hypothetical protein